MRRGSSHPHIVSRQLLPILLTNNPSNFLSFYKYYLTPHVACLTAGSQPFALRLCLPSACVPLPSYFIPREIIFSLVVLLFESGDQGRGRFGIPLDSHQTSVGYTFGRPVKHVRRRQGYFVLFLCHLPDLASTFIAIVISSVASSF